MNTPASSMAWVITGAFIGSFGAVGLKAGSKRLEKNVMALLTNWPIFRLNDPITFWTKFLPKSCVTDGIGGF